MKRGFPLLLSLLVSLGSARLNAQNPVEPVQPNPVPIYRVEVVGRTIKAINFRNRSGETKVDFRGTSLMPRSSGDADVQSRAGTIKVDVRFKHMQPASGFGPEYMTYVLWAHQPGRPPRESWRGLARPRRKRAD